MTYVAEGVAVKSRCSGTTGKASPRPSTSEPDRMLLRVNARRGIQFATWYLQSVLGCLSCNSLHARSQLLTGWWVLSSPIIVNTAILNRKDRF